ncbi:uncharacterized protein LOC121637448 [Melanotaenia boesemani]|uniref:uncharacterized protein LOC121637448 n=1 Tax=Melanotaenia boesemani TaxID=1250792 RepID=UPI001C04A65E|nr:uncharacterized protein LOC121637448 [Melanotaenia boesemani]
MSNTRLQNFRSFLTEHFTTFAVDVFSEVESIVEAYYEENKRLKSILHMVLNPRIKLSKIDINHYIEANTGISEQPTEPNGSDSEISDHLPTEPKEEQIECSITCESNQQEWPVEKENIQMQVCVKEDPEEEKTSMPCIASSYCIQEYNPDSSGTVSVEEERDEHSDSFSVVSEEDAPYSPLSEGKESMSNSVDLQDSHETSNTKNPKSSHQKTMLQIPRMMVLGSLDVNPHDQQSFLQRLHEAFKDFPEDEKPLITKMGLTTDVEWVECAVGLVPKGSPLSYQLPLPSSKDFKPHDDAPLQPLLPLSYCTLEPASTTPTLTAEEQVYVNDMHVTWEEAQYLQSSTRGCKESAEKLQKMRITSRFREICKLKPGQSHAEQLVLKILRGPPRCKTTQIDQEMKPGAVREYCKHLCVNWSPCGLVVHPNAPWLAAIPDGLVYDPKEQSSHGLLHIKCAHLQSFVECSFLICRDGVLQLKRSHAYYWHIQGEMMITGMSWCDLLVHSRGDILVQRIYRDEATIRLMNKKLEEFFFSYYLPSLV